MRCEGFSLLGHFTDRRLVLGALRVSRLGIIELECKGCLQVSKEVPVEGEDSEEPEEAAGEDDEDSEEGTEDEVEDAGEPSNLCMQS